MSWASVGVGPPGDQLEATPGDQLHADQRYCAAACVACAGPFGSAGRTRLSPAGSATTEWGASSVPAATSAPGSSTL